MKSNKPLKRKSPLKRTPLKQRSEPGTLKKSPLKKSKLKPVSSKREAWLKQYRSAKRALGPGPHACRVCGVTTEHGSYHHPKGRSKLEYLLEFYWTCSPCHQNIHSNPQWAMSRGWLQPEIRGRRSEPGP